ncbi:hypothetical protein H5410_030922 [Solanum commersonii]|uniref:Uncharacterized protein n=1 Tax=Solanum commersonii TaxID=4109 RepID=A0A9J5YIT1_SOLCO|nr:hypothetical protein H5410_030922 [Solanum commersonii]
MLFFGNMLSPDGNKEQLAPKNDDQLESYDLDMPFITQGIRVVDSTDVEATNRYRWTASAGKIIEDPGEGSNIKLMEQRKFLIKKFRACLVGHFDGEEIRNQTETGRTHSDLALEVGAKISAVVLFLLSGWLGGAFLPLWREDRKRMLPNFPFFDEIRRISFTKSIKKMQALQRDYQLPGRQKKLS